MKETEVRFADVCWRDNLSCQTNHYNIGEQYIGDNGALPVCDEDKKIVWKIYHEKLLSTSLCGLRIVHLI